MRIIAPPTVKETAEAFDEDNRKMADLIARESFPETLRNTADLNQNYFRLSGFGSNVGSACMSTTRIILKSRRFAKLLEQYRAEPGEAREKEILEQFRRDLNTLQKRIADSLHSKTFGQFEDTLHAPELKDQSELNAPLCYRIICTEMLIGQMQLWKALPLVVRHFELTQKTMLCNWTSMAYACDKILSAEPPPDLSPAQLKVRRHYLIWKKSLLFSLDKRKRNGRHFFRYEHWVMPSFRSPRRPGDLSVFIGARLPGVNDYGRLEIECPPVEPGSDDGYSAHADGLYITPASVQPEIIEFARRLVAAG